MKTHGLTHVALAVKDVSQGQFAPGLPYVFFEDPDGYEVEVRFEVPTSADPKPARRSKPR